MLIFCFDATYSWVVWVYFSSVGTVKRLQAARAALIRQIVIPGHRSQIHGPWEDAAWNLPCLCVESRWRSPSLHCGRATSRNLFRMRSGSSVLTGFHLPSDFTHVLTVKIIIHDRGILGTVNDPVSSVPGLMGHPAASIPLLPVNGRPFWSSGALPILQRIDAYFWDQWFLNRRFDKCLIIGCSSDVDGFADIQNKKECGGTDNGKIII